MREIHKVGIFGSKEWEVHVSNRLNVFTMCIHTFCTTRIVHVKGSCPMYFNVWLIPFAKQQMNEVCRRNVESACRVYDNDFSSSILSSWINAACIIVIRRQRKCPNNENISVYHHQGRPKTQTSARKVMAPCVLGFYRDYSDRLRASGSRPSP